MQDTNCNAPTPVGRGSY